MSGFAEITEVVEFVFIVSDEVLTCILDDVAKAHVNIRGISLLKLKDGTLVKILPDRAVYCQEQPGQDPEAVNLTRNVLMKYQLKFKEQIVLSVAVASDKPGQLALIYKALFCRMEVLGIYTDELENTILEVSEPKVAQELLQHVDEVLPCKSNCKPKKCPCRHCRGL